MPSVLHGLTSEFAHGRAFSEVVPIANPAVASGFTYTVGGNYWERIVALSFTIVTDNNAANRQVLVAFKDGTGTNIASTASGGTQADFRRRWACAVWTPRMSAAWTMETR